MRGPSVLGIGMLAGVLACGGDDNGSSQFSSGGPGLGSSASATEGTGSGGTGDSGATGGPGGSEGDGTTGGGTDPGGTSTTSDDSGPPDGATTSACMGMPDGQSVLGDSCVDGCECASGICFALPLVGTACSSCLTDEECQTNGVGTCSLDAATESAACTQGELGVMCQPQSDGCAVGLQCAQLIDTGGALPDTFCSECASSADCAGGEVCAPMVVINGLQPGGFLQCVPPGSAPDGSFCPASGDASSCASGICAVIDIAGLGIADIGVCGPCASDADCGGGTCQPPTVDADGATPSQCV